jgi:tetratricopeptide (TPR) repeat protein
LAGEIGDKENMIASLTMLGSVALGMGDHPKSKEVFEHSVALSREYADKRRLSAALNNLAELHRTRGDFDEAEKLYEEALTINRERGSETEVIVNLLNLAMTSISRGSLDRAKSLTREALAIVCRIGSRPLGLGVLELSIGIAALCDQAERGALFFGAAAAQTDQMKLMPNPADMEFLAPFVAQIRQFLGAERFAEAEAAGRALNFEEAIRQVRTWLSNVA